MAHLAEFHHKLRQRWQGSLVSVRQAGAIDRNAKEYMNRLAKLGKLERVSWGWYWVPADCADFLDFLAKDKNFKVLQKQSAAAVWNGDFVHRNHFTVAVEDESYGRALEEFARSRGWGVFAEKRHLKNAQYEKLGKLYVEALEETIVDCLKAWAFTDAFSSLYENRRSIDWRKVSRHYWERVGRSNARVGQVLKYGLGLISRARGKDIHSGARVRIGDDFVRRQVEEAAEKVAAFA